MGRTRRTGRIDRAAVVAIGGVVGVVSAVGLVASTSAAADVGVGRVSLYQSGSVYGDEIFFGGSVYDDSGSCRFVGDCDQPTGEVIINLFSVNGTIGYTTPLVDEPLINGPFANYRLEPQQPPFFPAAVYNVNAIYQGNFTQGPPTNPGGPGDTVQDFTLAKRPCATALTQSLQETAPGAPFTLTADVSTSVAPATGTVTFFQDDGTPALDIVLDSISVNSGTNTATTAPVTVLPSGSTTIYATYAGDGNHEGGCRSNEVVHTVTAVPDPTAGNDGVQTHRDVPVTFDVLGNDGDPAGATVAVEVLSGPENGSLAQDDLILGRFTYEPEQAFVGDDVFTYYITGSGGRQSAPATVAIEVACESVAVSDSYTTPFDTPLVVNLPADLLLENDDPCERFVSVDVPPEHGTISGFDGTGLFTYTPATGYAGPDSFTYVYTAGTRVVDVGSVFLTVLPDPNATSSTTASTATSSTSSSTSTTRPTGGSSTTTTTVPTTSTTRPGTSPPPPTSGCPPAPFTDVPADSVHKPTIDCAYATGLTRGTTADSYEPGGTVSRGQMATFLIRLATLAGADVPEDPPDAFDDDDGTTHELAIDQLAALGVTLGTGDGFGPEIRVSRAQMASFLVRLYVLVSGHEPSPTTDAFDDDDGDVHEDAINALFELGLTLGDADGGFHPSAGLRRDQMASFLVRALALLSGQGSAAASTT